MVHGKVSHTPSEASSEALNDKLFLTQKLSAMGLTVLPTWTNFVYVDVGEDCVAIAKRLQAEGVIIRPLAGWGAKTAIRVTVGRPEENELFVSAMKKVMMAAVR